MDAALQIAGRVAAAIVPITYADQAQVTDMLRHAAGETGDHPEPVGTAAAFIAAVGTGWGCLFGARVGARLVGYARLDRRRLPGSAIGILALHVLAPYRRQGLGEALLCALLAAAGQTGWIEEVRVVLPAHGLAELRPWPNVPPMDQVWLSVDPANTPAMRLYEKLGFVRGAPPPVDWTVPPQFLTMVREVAPRR